MPKAKSKPSEAKVQRKGSASGSDSPAGRKHRKETPNVLRRKEIALTTLDAIKLGHYTVDDEKYDLKDATALCCEGTKYYEPDSELGNWQEETPAKSFDSTNISVLEITSIQSARMLRDKSQELSVERVGVLNFADAKKEGGLFLDGAQAQEESIARTSTLYSSLMTPEAQQYYDLHREYCGGKYPESPYAGGFYSHAMIFSPDVTVFREDDQEAVFHPPFLIDVVTSPAVNNGVVIRRTKKDSPEREEGTKRVRETMLERMARILFLFEKRGVDSIVLGSFGTGVFRNDVGMVASYWVDFLGPGKRFEKSFRNVVFGVIGHDTYLKFKEIVGPLEKA